MTTPENTSTRDPLVHLVGALGDGSTYITDMEAAGQRQLVASSVLPADGPWAELEALGFVKGEGTDDLFVQATLPPGWTKEGSDHAMWSYLLDERGVRRVAVFYKAAFYDRCAFARLERPGYSASTEALYGEGPVALPAKWDLFSEDERADFIAGLDAMEQNIAECPQVYEPHAARTAELRALVNEVPL